MRIALSWCCCIALLIAVACGQNSATQPGGRELTIDLGGGVSMEMVLVRPGSFMMGSVKGEDDEKPVHKVNLARPFYIGKFEVTQEQWQAVMGENPSSFRGLKNPVENVSWDDCQEFLQKVAVKIPGRTLRLPTEAQWEYACRAGSVTEYSFGNDPTSLAEYAWYGANSGQMSHPVGQKKPNAWGLYDMHGNVCEWCSDWYAAGYPSGEATDPTGPPGGEAFVLRGESWVSTPELLRSSYRVGTPKDYRNTHVGLRLVCLPPG